MAKWSFSCNDNGGKKQFFVVSANNKTDAIQKAFKKARKNAAGDIITWNCTLKSV